MTTADEILDAMQEEESEIGVLVIDNNLRTITIPPSMTILGVEGDDDVHRVKFRMPRYYGEFDLSGFGVRINYQNANKEEDAYIVEDKEADDAHIAFSWLVGRNALRYKGAVKFSVCMRLLEDGLVVREFNTTTASLPSLEGLETDLSEGEEEQARDLAEQIKVQIRAAGDGQMVAVKETGMQQVADVKAEGTEQVKSIEDKGAATLASIPADYTALSEGVSSLTEHKASAIIDISARAARHELYAQRESPLGVTLHGYTYQEGEGDPSPENVRPIHGLDVAQVRAGGKNFFDLGDSADDYIKGAANVMGVDRDAGTVELRLRMSGETYALRDILCPIKPGDQVTMTMTASAGTAANKPNERLMLRVFDKNLNVIKSGVGGVYNDYYQAFYIADRTKYTFAIVNENAAYAMFGLGMTMTDPVDNLLSGIASNIMATFDIDANYEPYLATTADLPLLPDGAPLMGDGTADDTAENNVPSGCNKRKVISGADDLTLEGFDASKNVVYSDTAASIAVTDGVITSALTYPTTVYYRSTDYTPDKQLTTARTVRRWRTVKLADLTWKLNGTNMEGLPVYYASLSPVPRDEGENRMVCNVLPAVRIYHNATPCIYIDTTYGSRVWVVAKADIADASELTAWLTDAAFAVYQLATAETYATDPLPLYKPAALESDTVTVTGSGETEVEYAHDTKHYIDSKISELVTLALANN